MSEELLQYYNRELAYLRRQGAEFARAYPKVAGRLRVSDEAVEDPHVSRLLEGVAFLTSQIRQRLDGHFPELTDILMGSLYPDYQAPIPSMTVLQLGASRAQTHCSPLSANQAFETRVEKMPVCEFRAPGEHYIAPVKVESAGFQNAPFDAPRPVGTEGAQSVITLRLSAPTPFSEIDLPWLRFFLHGQAHLSNELYDLIHRTGLGVAVSPISDRRQLRYFPATQLQAVGFADDEALIPWTNRSMAGYRLLAEFFLFPEKFLFTQLNDMAGHWPDATEIELTFYLGETSQELEKSFQSDHMRLWCVPVVNLFEESLEPAPLDDLYHEHRLVSRYRKADAFEVVNVESVSLVNSGKMREMAPYYGLGHPRWQTDLDLFWHLHRRPADWAGGQMEPGTETVLTLVDNRYDNRDLDAIPDDEALVIKAQCCNRNIPDRLPFGGGDPTFKAVAEPLIDKAEALLAPTSTVRPELDGASRWQFIRHLNLEYFTGEDASDRLKAVLQLYDFRKTPESRAMVEGIEKVHVRRVTARVGKGIRSGLTQGTEFQVTFSRPRYAGTSIYLFSAVLDRFLAQFAQLNSFTRLRIRLAGHSRDYHVWPARAGERELV